MRLDGLLKDNELQEKVELKGSFCMERCGEGLNWQIEEEPMTSANVEEAVATFKKRVMDPLSQGE